MQVTKIMPSDQETTPTAHKFTQEELQMEFNYMQAERITKKLLERGLITVRNLTSSWPKTSGRFLRFYRRSFEN